MSNYVPVYLYPGGNQITIPNENNVVYKWIDSLGGEVLPGPISHGTLRPDGNIAHGGVATENNGTLYIEYHCYEF